MKGWTTYLAGASLILIGLGSLLTAMGHCIEDVSTILNGWEICRDNVSEAWGGVLAALAGLGFVGARRAIGNATTESK